jgi:YD repeat-containing protein
VRAIPPGERRRRALTWGDRGNLLHGVFTYTYNTAGRMVQAASVTATVRYTYTVDGLRIAQNVNGEELTFTWDWVTAIPELLSDGANVYLVRGP